MPSTLESNVSKAEIAYKTLNTSLTKLQTEAKTSAKNYENAVAMFWASKDQIKELELKVHEGKDPKAPGELKKWKDNHPAVAARVKPVNQTIIKLKEGAAQAKKSADVVAKTVETLNKDAARAAMEDVKKTAAALKTMTAGVKTVATAAEKLRTELDSLPKCPTV